MAAIIYFLCALTALGCTVLLLRSYRIRKHRLLLWSGLGFAGLFINNALLVLDRLVLIELDLSNWRLIAAFIALLPLLFGLIWEEE